MFKTKKISATLLIVAVLSLNSYPSIAQADVLDSIKDGVSSISDKMNIGSILGIASNIVTGGLTLPISIVSSISGLFEKMNPSNMAEKYAESALNSANNNLQGVINKTDPPGVEVVFTAEKGLIAGSHVTATAIPSFFKTTTEELYYTWYLKRANCALPDNEGGEASDVDACDEDGNGKITENDWKVAATKVMLAGTSNENELDAEGAPIIEDKYSASVPSTKTQTDAGHLAEEFTQCYVREPVSGLDYEIQRVEAQFNACPEGQKLACVKSDQHDTCDVLNPAYDFDVATQNLADIEAAKAWNADPLNQSDPAYPMAIPEPYGLYKWDGSLKEPVPDEYPKSVESQTKDFCAVTNENYFCKITDDADLLNYKASVDCYDGEIAMCVNDSGNTVYPNSSNPLVDPYTSVVFGKDNLCSSLSVNDNSPSITNLYNPQGEYPVYLPWDDVPGVNGAGSGVPNPLFEDLVGQDCSEALEITGADGNCEFIKEKGDSQCEHLFAQPGKMTKSDGTVVDASDEVTGNDDKLTSKEMQFWGVDPTKFSIEEEGKYEEIVAGLGMDSFTWMYSKGDQVGVAIEGESTTPTLHADSTYKRTWAFSNGECEELTNLTEQELISTAAGESNTNKRGIYYEGVGGAEVCDPNDRTKCSGFLTAEIDLNDCLEENLLDPIVDSPSKLGIELIAVPVNPVNDSNGNGDTLTVKATEMNTENSSTIKYEWSVQKSMDGPTAPIDTTQWLDITDDMQSNGAFSSSDVSGLGKEEFSIELNMAEDLIENGWSNTKISSFGEQGVFYLKVKLKIVSGAADGGQDTEGYIIVRITQQQNKINAYHASADSTGMLSLDSTENEANSFCDDYYCYVASNEVIGLEIPVEGKSTTATNEEAPFLWTINGEAISCGEEVSTECANGNVLFFPVIGNSGEIVNVIANGVGSTGEAIEVNKQFVIGATELEILPSGVGSCSSECIESSDICPKFLGQYYDLAGTPYPDCSETIFEAKSTSSINLSANSGTGFVWTIDGQENLTGESQIQLAMDKLVGENYNIGLYSEGSGQTQGIRLALFKNWGISQEETIDEPQNAYMQIDVVENTEQTTAAAAGSFFGASLITYLPQQLMFLLKISLTSLALFFLTGVLFSFMPERIFEKREED
ncbi:MAG: hypothetical protein ACD_9C00021G0002 [uncultured bacterium]|nr:MAG: hypothetical protein ACD_9C00021G0002 [uncultured bacterium]